MDYPVGSKEIKLQRIYLNISKSKPEMAGDGLQILTWGNSKERCCEPSPHIWDALCEVVGESLLLKGGQTVGDDMSDPGQISKVVTHIHQS